jgi:replicative DNA helicase
MPLMSDFRESGNIEQDADILIGIERETRPNQETPVTEAKLHIMKQRNGATGEVLLEYLPERTLFRDRDIPSFEGGF